MINRIKKTVFPLCLVFTMLVGSVCNLETTVSKAIIDIQLSQTAAKSNSVSFKWSYDKPVDIFINGTYVKKNLNKKSYTYKNKSLTPGQSITIEVRPHGQNEGVPYILRTKPPYINSAPITYDAVIKYVSFNWIANSGACDGYQVSVYNYKKKKTKKYDVSDGKVSTFELLDLQRNQFVKAKVRGYIKLFNGKKVYGAWSGYRYGAFMSGLKVEKKSGRKIKASWSRVSNVAKYDVLVGTKADASDAVKMKTLKKTATSYTASKMGKDALDTGKYYYVFVRPYVKSGKKTKKSDLIGSGDGILFYNFE